MPKAYTWKTACIIRETADAVTISFDTSDEEFNFKPGQFINLTLMINDTAVTRSYSLCSTPDEDEKPAITVKKVERGLVSEYIINNAEEINNWNVNGPHGSFYADPDKPGRQNIVLIGGGSGITPLYSILKYYLKHTDVNIQLINCNRTWDDVIFRNGLSYLELAYSDRFAMWHFLSRASKGKTHTDKSFLPEKLNKILLKKNLKKLVGNHLAETDYFICGPSGLIQLSKEVLASIGIKSSQIHAEYFVASEEANATIALPQTVREVLVHYFERSILIEVEPGKTILESALDDKMPLSYSCKTGTCGICVGKHTSGKLHMQNNYALTEDQIREGYVLLCQSHPIDDNVTVVIE